MASGEQLRRLGERIRQLRERRGLSQDAVAAAAGYQRSSIANIEAGRQDPPLTRLTAIAAVLEVPLGDLLSGEADQPLEGPQVALYARAWHAEATAVLDEQVALLQNWAAAHGALVGPVVREVAGPLEIPRQLLALVTESRVPTIAVCHKDQLGWFNVPFIEAILETQGRQLVNLGIEVISAIDTWSALCHVRDLFSSLLQTLHGRLSSAPQMRGVSRAPPPELSLPEPR